MKVRKKTATRMLWTPQTMTSWQHEIERAVRKADRKYSREARWFRDEVRHGRFLTEVAKIEEANFKKWWEQL